jgi:hypothetical protein
VLGIAFHPTQAGVVYVTTAGGWTFKSVNGGATFATIHKRGGPDLTSLGTLIIVPESPDTLYAASAKGVWKTVDGGASWTPMNAGLGSLPAISVAVVGSSTVLAAVATVGAPPFQAAIYASTDGAASWTTTGLTGLSTAKVILTADRGTPPIAYATGAGLPLFKSQDAGVHWFLVGPYLSTVDAFIATGGSPGKSASYASTGILWKSTDGWTTWTDVTAAAFTGQQVLALAADPVNAGTVYAGTGSAGVFRTRDGGATWVSASAGIESAYVTALAVDPLLPNRLLAAVTYGGLLRTMTAGD